MIKFLYAYMKSMEGFMKKKAYVSPSVDMVDVKEDIMVISTDNDVLWDPMWNDS